MMGLNEIREAFLSFYEKKGHLRSPSFSLIPEREKSLLLINSGMAPMKPYFSGEVKPPSKRMTTCQKCVRVNDIDNVGKTSRHGTYFEMLGNFSFGDYFKKEAIPWAWEFLLDVMKMDPAKLYPSVYIEDDEAYQIWTRDVGVDASHVVRLGKADNFWEIGSGPCGPSSEVYFDRGAQTGCGQPDCTPGCACDRFIEICNLVFTQFHSDGNGQYTPLPFPNIDTGMGLERMGMALQGVASIFEIDTMAAIMGHVCDIAGVTYKGDAAKDISLRIITDHIRASTLLIGDGVLPSNEGRGYVLRRLLRRAARNGKLLGVQKPFLHEVCATVIAANEGAYPSLRERADSIKNVILLEEESFGKTVDAGLRMLRALSGELLSRGEKELPGADAFQLYDTFGFPIDLTVEILSEQGMTLRMEEFTALMAQQRERARRARAADGDVGWQKLDTGLDPELKTDFTGYTELSSPGVVLALLDADGVIQQAGTGQRVSLILDRTPFYAESGGQAADTGILRAPAGVIRVDDVQKARDGKFMHIGEVVEGMISTGDKVEGHVDTERRHALMRAHSATHLLQAAIRQTLGDHVEQGGSYVEPDRLRFDYTHFSAPTGEQLETIGTRVNDMILAGYGVTTEVVTVEEAKARGALALFGEKYGDTVRLVTMGDVSAELCGGTHVDNTAMAGPFVIESESSVAAGMRRIEARVGKAVLSILAGHARLLRRLADELKTSPAELEARFKQTMSAYRSLVKENRKQQEGSFRELVAAKLASAAIVGGVRLLTLSVKDIDKKTLQTAGDFLRDKAPDIAAVLASAEEGKTTFFAVAGKDAISAGVKANDLIRIAAQAAGGSGGGRPDSAMGGAKDGTKTAEALAAAETYVGDLLS